MCRAIAYLWLLLASSPPLAQPLGPHDTLILADPGDPYYALADSLDTRYLFSPVHGSDIVMLVIGILSWPVVWLILRRRGSSHGLVPALLTGFSFAVIQGLYALARLERRTITSQIVGFNPLALVSTFLLVSCGALLFLNARSWRGRAVALLVATSSALLPAVAQLSPFLVADSLAARAGFAAGLWNASLGTQPLIVFVFECLLFGLVFLVLNRMVQSGEKETENL